MRFQRVESPLKLEGLEESERFFAGCLAEGDQSVESLWVAHVDGDARCLHFSRHDGDPRGVEIPVGKIIRDAATHGSKGLVLAHNHPSGDPQPSQADCRMTRRLADVAETIDCTVLDHLVFAGRQCVSMRAMGLL